MPMAIGTRATAPLVVRVLEVVGRVAARTDVSDQYHRQRRRHDEPARVDEPFQLLALDGAGPAVTERQRHDGGQAGRHEQRPADPAEDGEDAPGRPGHAQGAGGGRWRWTRERRCYREPTPPWRCRRPTPLAASGARAANRSGTAAGRTRRTRRRGRTASPASCPRRGSAANCSRSSPVVATAYDRPVADMSQPIGFAGRFHASNAPTLAKPTMNVTAATPSAAFPVPPLQLRRQRVDLVVDERGGGRRQGQHPDAQRAPERGPRRHVVAAGGAWLLHGTGFISHLLLGIIRRPTCGQKGASPLPRRRPPPGQRGSQHHRPCPHAATRCASGARAPGLPGSAPVADDPRWCLATR